jgi:mono/diheme cytochrome c family protein
MKHALLIFAFTILTTLFYWYVGQQVPQKETHPPKELILSADLTTEEMIQIGAEIVNGKGTCQTCHGLPGGRFPDLHNAGATAASRIDGYSDVEYLAESLYEPNKFIVAGFAPGMPNINKPPIALTDEEILTVIAYLQSQGGTPTVTMDTKLKWQGSTPAVPLAAPTAASAAPSNLSGEEIFQTYACNTCHSVDAPTPLVGPSLYDAGNRLSKAEIYESILDPDAKITEGFVAGVMPATLNAGGFYNKVTSGELKKLVEYIASLKGGK